MSKLIVGYIFEKLPPHRQTPRNKILFDGLKLNGVKVHRLDTFGPILQRLRMIDSFVQNNPDIQCLIVSATDYYDVPLAKIVSIKYHKPLVYDVYNSVYETTIVDRKLHKRTSPIAIYNFAYDTLINHLPNKSFLDTNEHINYFVKTFKVPQKKIDRIFVGTDTSIFKIDSRIKKPKTFTAYYHGHFIPLHGVETIIEAAGLLSDQEINFTLLGEGQEKKKIKKLIKKKKLDHITLKPKVAYKQLAKEAQKAHVFLAGPFGNTTKARRVIPNKVFESLALKIPTIVSDTKAMRELFSEKEVYFVPTNDPEALAKKIIQIKKKYSAALKRTKRGQDKVLDQCTPKALGKELKLLIEETI